MDTKKYVEEISKNEKSQNVLATLNAYKVELLKETKDAAFIAAAKALEAAKAEYKKESTRIVLADGLYNELQTTAVRTAVSEFSRAHKLPTLFTWFEENGKDEQVGIIDTAQKLGSHIKSLHDSFVAGNKVARKKAKTIEELQAEAAVLLAKIAEMKGE